MDTSLKPDTAGHIKNWLVHHYVLTLHDGTPLNLFQLSCKASLRRFDVRVTPDHYTLDQHVNPKQPISKRTRLLKLETPFKLNMDVELTEQGLPSLDRLFSLITAGRARQLPVRIRPERTRPQQKSIMNHKGKLVMLNDTAKQLKPHPLLEEKPDKLPTTYKGKLILDGQHRALFAQKNNIPVRTVTLSKKGTK